METSQRGFAWLLILIVLGLVVIGGGAYFVMRQNAQTQTLAYQPQTNTPAQTFVATSTEGAFLAKCPSATPVVDGKGNSSGARESTGHVWVDPYQYWQPAKNNDFLQINDCGAEIDADPATFIALDQYYSKDAKHVWIIQNPSEEGALRSALISGADPSTFTLIPDPHSGDPEGVSDKYTKDMNHVYAYGQLINGAEVKTFTIDDPLATTSMKTYSFPCLVDAHDAHNKYYRGAVVSNTYCHGV